MKVTRENIERASARRRVNQGMVALLKYKGRNYVAELGAGYSDDVELWRKGKELVALSMNRGLGYVGVQVFELNETPDDIFPHKFQADEIASYFFQNADEELSEIVGPGPRGGYGVLDYSPRTIANRIMACMN